MTTQLKDGDTVFVPFNQGSNGAGVDGGAGNPGYPDGYATHYLWEEILQRDSLLDILHRFIFNCLAFLIFRNSVCRGQ